jgi:hypothetical protein
MRYRQALLLTAEQIATAVRDSQPVDGETKGFLHSALKAVGLGKDERRRQEAAMAALAERLSLEIGKTTARLLTLHKLDPGEASRINARVRDNFAIRAPVDKAQAGLLGAVVSGAATGLSADLMAGGLTMGGGAILGAIVGALTMAGAAWGFNVRTERDQPTVQFADAFLQTLLVGGLLRYLAVAHFGRGRGNFVEGEAPPFWQAEVESVVTSQAGDLGALWSGVRAAPDSAAAVKLVKDLVTRLADATLARLYPAVMAKQAPPAREAAPGVSSAS